MTTEQDAAVNIPNNKEPGVPETGEQFSVAVDFISQAPDDSELIDAYERAVKNAKEKIFQKRPELRLLEENDKSDAPNENSNLKIANKFNKPKKQRAKGKGNWKSGQSCRAIFSGDNQEYEAVLCTLNPERDECVVKFSGYGNKEKVPLSSLTPSYGPTAILEQKIRASTLAESTVTDLNESFYSPSSSTCNSHKFIPADLSENSSLASKAIPPIPPPPFLAGQSIESTDSLSSVLMAWYMAGYHTGFYAGSLRSKENKPYGRKA